MTEWERVPFGWAVADVTSASPRLPRGEYADGGSFPVIDQGAHEIAGYTDDPSVVTSLDSPRILFGDHTRRFKLVSTDFVVGADGVKVLRPDPDFDANFLFRYLESVDIPSAGYSRHFKFLKDVTVPFPPLPEQRRIAAILDQTDALRQKRQESIRTLNALQGAIFEEMFGTPASDGPRVDDLIQGAQYGSSSKAGPSGEFPILRMGNITPSGSFDLSDMKYIDVSDRDREKYLVHAGDVLFNRTNSAELVGKTGQYVDPQPMAYAGYLVRLRPHSAADGAFITGYLNSLHGKATLRSMAKSIVGMANINAREARAIRLPHATAEDRSRYASILTAIRLRRSALVASGEELDALFSSLQHRAFRGEL